MTSAECPICLDFCSVDGEHRLVVTKCGHLFGHCCLLITLKTKKECPTCRKPLKPRDIVKIYDAKAMTNEHVTSEEDKSLELELQRERELREKAEREREADRKRLRELERLMEVQMASTQDDRDKRRRVSENVIDLVSSPPPKNQRNTSKFNMNSQLISELSVCNGRVLRLREFDDHIQAIASCQYNEQHMFAMQNVDNTNVSYFGETTAAYTDFFARPERLPSGDICAVNNTTVMKIFSSRHSQKPVAVSLGEHRGWTCSFSNVSPYEVLVGTAHGRVLVYDLRHSSTTLYNILVCPPTHGNVYKTCLNDASTIRKPPIQSMYEAATSRGRGIAIVQGGACQILDIAGSQGYIGPVEMEGSPHIHAFDVQGCPNGAWLNSKPNSMSILLSRRGSAHITNSLSSNVCLVASVFDSSQRLLLPKVYSSVGVKVSGRFVGPISSRCGICVIDPTIGSDASLLLACPDEYTKSVHMKVILRGNEVYDACQLRDGTAAVRQCGLAMARLSNNCILASLSCDKLKLFSVSIGR